MSRAVDAVPTLARNALPIRSSSPATNCGRRFDVRDARRAVVDHRFASVGVELGVGAAAQLRASNGRRRAGRTPTRSKRRRMSVSASAGAHAGDGVDGRRAGAAGVDHQRADALAGGRYPDDGQLCLCALRIRVVDRDGHGAALRGRDVAGVADELFTAAPYRWLAVGLCRRSLGRGVCGGHVTPATSTHASSAAPLLPARRMADMVARTSRLELRRNRTVTLRRPSRAQRSIPLVSNGCPAAGR